MEILSPFSNHDIIEEFKCAIEEQGRKKNWIANQLGISKGHLNNILNNGFTLTEENRKKLNELLNTSI